MGEIPPEAYLAMTLFRLAADVRIGSWLYAKDSGPLLQVLGLYFYAEAFQKGVFLARTGFTGGSVDVWQMIGVLSEVLCLAILTWRFYRKGL